MLPSNIMFYLIAILILGISFSPFPFFKLDIWRAQAVWGQLGTLLLLAYSFFENPKRHAIRSLPIALLVAWVSLSTTIHLFPKLSTYNFHYIFDFIGKKEFVLAEIQKVLEIAKFLKILIIMFFPLFNFLCIVILYRLFTQYLTRQHIINILKGMRYVVIFTLFCCVLQKFGLSQVFALLYKGGWQNNIVTGFIGNGTHLSGFLGSCSPLFFWNMKREDNLVLILMVMVLLFTGTTVGDPSIAGYAILVCLAMYFFKKKTGAIVTFIGVFLIFLVFAIDYIPPIFFNDHGRVDIWVQYWELYKPYALMGTGLGSINILSQLTTVPTARQLHFEFYQFMIELGLVGLVLIIYLVKDFICEVAGDKLQLVVKAMFIGFLLAGCMNFPAHIWLSSLWAVFVFSAFQVLKKGDSDVGIITQRN